MTNKSGVSSQALTLPSGGGAIQGIGETFSPDPFTGTGKFSVPITIPPGRNGFQPELNLVYSAGNGAGPFGLGWELSLPGVSRKTSKGVPQYRDAAAPQDQDTFILSGAEDLVRVAEPAPGVTRFKPRTEGLFARIERVRDGGADFWRVRSKDGRTSLYGAPLPGQNDTAVIADPAAHDKIFAWKLTETTDPFGNRIAYDYLRDSGTDGPHTWDQLYLQRIQYIDFDDAGQTRFLVSVTFTYDQRPDAFSQHRAGFEIRTRLRCKRIEIRTHADQELLARSYELTYVDERVAAGELPESDLPRNGVSLLSQVKLVGHDGDLTEAIPALQFGYTPFTPERQRIEAIQAVGNALPPRSLADDAFELVSLFGNGLPDIVQMNGTARFWRNLGRGLFDAPRIMDQAPAGIHLGDPGVQFADMNGDGRADLLALGQQGYFPLDVNGRWSSVGFVQYATAPSLNLGDPNTRLVDLDGDGVIDALHTGTSFELFFNDPLKGWQAAEARPRQPMDRFPDVSFSDPRVKLADMCGDHLDAFVLVDQGRVDYWPNLGHGRWGARVSMANSPVFPVAGGGFDPKKVLLGDVDGDGLQDIVYLEPDRLTIWINQAGEGWSDPITITGTPAVEHLDAVRIVDILGTGMAGVLWTSDQAGGAGSNFQFLDLTASTKPYLLESMDNQLGANTRVRYAPSTVTYLADDANPTTRWKTSMPFPVLVVDQVEVIDGVSRGKLTTQYSYHHGYWDGSEREFRGFGRVEQLSSETFAAFNQGGLHGDPGLFNAVSAVHFAAPTLLKTWFHLGAIPSATGPRHEADFSSEYFADDGSVLQKPDETVTMLQGLPESHRAQALRTLRGSVVRTELFGLDQSDRQQRPYTVTESQYGVRNEMPGPDTTAQTIFFPHPAAQRVTQWERGNEPMTTFSFAGDFDKYGLQGTQTTLSVPRGRDFRVAAGATDAYLGGHTVTTYAQRDDATHYMVDRLASSTAYDITNDGSQAALELIHDVRSGSGSLALIAQTFNYYDGDAFTGLPPGVLGDTGALVRAESLMVVEATLQAAFGQSGAPAYLRGDAAPEWPAEYPQEFRDTLQALAGYTFADGTDHRARGYWSQDARVAFDFHVSGLPSRGLPTTVRDPLGHETQLAYDSPFHYLPVELANAAGLPSTADVDYRVLELRQVTDPNGNRRAVVRSPLGLVKATALMGKQGASEGDTVDAPGSRLEYDLFAFATRQQPVFVRSIARQHHASDIDVPLPERDQTVQTVQFSDGFGRVLQTRTQIGDVTFGDSTFGRDVVSADQSLPITSTSGTARSSADPVNVVVSGWQTYDNQGRVVEKFEPFFSRGLDFDPATDAQLGQKVSTFYDPRGKAIRTVHPDGSEQRVVLGIPKQLINPDEFAPTPWEAYIYDPNDNAGRTHADTSSDFAAHRDTPTSVVVDALGRTVLATARNGPDPATDWYHTRYTYDRMGNPLSITDAAGRVAFQSVYDAAKRCWRIDSIDAGVRHSVPNVMGDTIETRNDNGAMILQTYDALRRPARVWARDDAQGGVTLRQRLEYGDDGRADQPQSDRAAARANNLLGQLARHYDEAGLTSVTRVDFKGNVLEKSRQVIADGPVAASFGNSSADGTPRFAFQVDWQTDDQHSLVDLEARLLEPAAYRTSSTFDAFNHVRAMQLPEDVDGRRRMLKPTYNSAGRLEQVFLDDTLYVDRVAYDSQGQRTIVAYANGVMTRYAYDQRTYRLQRLRTERYTKADPHTYVPTGAALQDSAFEYDLVGNVLRMTERAPGSGIPNNPDAIGQPGAGDPTLASLLASGDALVRRFTYDPAYRLTSATGRECDLPSDAPPWATTAGCADLTRARAYVDTYQHDAVGNVVQLQHQNAAGGFKREFSVDPNSNQLRSVQVGSASFGYTFDACGNMLSETDARHFEWNHANKLKAFRTQVGEAEASVDVRYLYDAGGQRVKKVLRKQGGQIEVTHYIDGIFDHHRWGNGASAGANNLLHIMDDKQRVCVQRVGPARPGDSMPATQFHFRDYLGSSTVVADEAGELVDREDFTPFGETSFGSFARKRYRFAGKERDEESGFTHHPARYEAPWLARWISCDPAGSAGGGNLYTYAFNNPVRYVDPKGTQPEPIELQGEEIIEVHGTAPTPDALTSAKQRGLSDPMSRDDMQRMESYAAASEYAKFYGVSLADARKAGEDYYRDNPDEESAYSSGLQERHNRYWASESKRLEDNYRRIDAAAGAVNAIAWGAIAGVAVIGGAAIVGVAGASATLTTTASSVTTVTAAAGGTAAVVNELDEELPVLEDTVTVYRFADVTNPETLVSRAGLSSQEVADDMATNLQDPDWLVWRAEQHAAGWTENSPFVSVVTNANKLVTSTDPWAQAITTGSPGIAGVQRAPFILQFEVPSSMLYMPTSQLSQSETEGLFFGTDLLRYLVNAMPNPYR